MTLWYSLILFIMFSHLNRSCVVLWFCPCFTLTFNVYIGGWWQRGWFSISGSSAVIMLLVHQLLAGMWNPQYVTLASRPMWPGQCGLEAKIFGLVVVFKQCRPCSHEGCPRGLVDSHRSHIIYVTFWPRPHTPCLRKKTSKIVFVITSSDFHQFW